MGIIFTSQEAVGAFPNGTRIKKHSSEDEDGHADGELGTVVGSLGPMQPEPKFNCKYGYFIEWDTTPGVPVFTAGFKVKEIAVS
jgi:hypothetical protein